MFFLFYGIQLQLSANSICIIIITIIHNYLNSTVTSFSDKMCSIVISIVSGNESPSPIKQSQDVKVKKFCFKFRKSKLQIPLKIRCSIGTSTAPQSCVAIAAQVSNAEIVHHHEDKIWPAAFPNRHADLPREQEWQQDGPWQPC